MANLAVLLWDSNSVSELIAEFSEIISTSKSQFFLKYENDIPIGFAQSQLRYDYVEGTKTSPVGYLEGIFIKEGYRKKGYAKELLVECEAWAKSNGSSSICFLFVLYHTLVAIGGNYWRNQLYTEYCSFLLLEQQNSFFEEQMDV